MCVACGDTFSICACCAASRCLLPLRTGSLASRSCSLGVLATEFPLIVVILRHLLHTRQGPALLSAKCPRSIQMATVADGSVFAHVPLDQVPGPTHVSRHQQSQHGETPLKFKFTNRRLHFLVDVPQRHRGLNLCCGGFRGGVWPIATWRSRPPPSFPLGWFRPPWNPLPADHQQTTRQH